MISRTSADFRRDFAQLPERVKKEARQAYKLFMANPNHPSLKFKKLPPLTDIWSVRVSDSYRAIGRWRGDVILWFFIGSHADYNKVIARL